MSRSSGRASGLASCCLETTSQTSSDHLTNLSANNANNKRPVSIHLRMVTLIVVVVVVVGIICCTDVAQADPARSEVWSDMEGLELKYTTNHDEILSNRGSDIQQKSHAQPTTEQEAQKSGQSRDSNSESAQANNDESSNGANQEQSSVSTDDNNNNSGGESSSGTASADGPTSANAQESSSGGQESQSENNNNNSEEQQTTNNSDSPPTEGAATGSGAGDTSGSSDQSEQNEESGNSASEQSADSHNRPNKMLVPIGGKATPEMLQDGPHLRPNSHPLSISSSSAYFDHNGPNSNDMRMSININNNNNNNNGADNDDGLQELTATSHKLHHHNNNKNNDHHHSSQQLGRQSMIDFDQMMRNNNNNSPQHHRHHQLTPAASLKENQADQVDYYNSNHHLSKSPLSSQHNNHDTDRAPYTDSRSLSDSRLTQENVDEGSYKSSSIDGDQSSHLSQDLSLEPTHNHRGNSMASVDADNDDNDSSQQQDDNRRQQHFGRARDLSEHSTASRSRLQSTQSGVPVSRTLVSPEQNYLRHHSNLSPQRADNQQQHQRQQHQRSHSTKMPDETENGSKSNVDSERDNFQSPGHFPGSMAHLTQAASEALRKEIPPIETSGVPGPVQNDDRSMSTIRAAQSILAPSSNVTSTSTPNTTNGVTPQATDLATTATTTSSTTSQQQQQQTGDAKTTVTTTRAPYISDSLAKYSMGDLINNRDGSVTTEPQTTPESQQLMPPILMTTTTVPPMMATPTSASQTESTTSQISITTTTATNTNTQESLVNNNQHATTTSARPNAVESALKRFRFRKYP